MPSTARLLYGVALFVVTASLCSASPRVLPLTHHMVTRKTLQVPSRTALAHRGGVGEDANPIMGGNVKAVFPLQGNINQFGEYFINITIGTPPQVMRVQVDTGSTDLVMYGFGCNGCPKASNVSLYACSKSKTCSPIDCQSDEFDCDVNNCWNDDYCPFDEEYGGGGSMQGYATQDILTLGPYKPARVSFGLIMSAHGAFEDTGVDGCWGFAYDQLSSWGSGPIVDTIINENQLYDAFGLCLNQDKPTLEIGTDYSSNSQFQWTTITEEIWYSVHMDDLSVGGSSLGFSAFTLNANGVIVDSGTTWIIFSDKKIWTKFQDSITSLCSKYHLPGVCNATTGKTLFDGYCYNMTQQDVSNFPNISVTLKGITPALTVQAVDYIYQGAGIPGVYCMGIGFINDSEIPFIIGDILLQKYHVVFDKKKKQIGFGPLSTCPQQ
eukprot:TRINITY_DN43_c0_g1_i1.p1 TRINITY_DN43_c0_g1~~TRINITY_DN43_c0_g1_i1.p1  ORF type:complete len:444 (-),score=82.36 TRINITY_DN43_c0_g1_i1:170-1480(-)